MSEKPWLTGKFMLVGRGPWLAYLRQTALVAAPGKRQVLGALVDIAERNPRWNVAEAFWRLAGNEAQRVA